MAAATAAERRPTWLPPVLTPWQRFKKNPTTFLAQYLYSRRTHVVSPQTPSTSLAISVVCISDTHTTQPEVPDSDLLLHAGDLTNSGSFEELQAQLDWLKRLPHGHKVVIAGNHDRLLDPTYVDRFPDRISEGTSRADLDWGDVIYLNNTSARLGFPNGRSLTVYGSPWTQLCGTFAFQYPDIRAVWSGTVPNDVDILLTHGPPKGHLDDGGKGCPQLLREIWRTRPRLAVFGHIHPGHGAEHIVYDGIQEAYDGVIAGDKGPLAVFHMACLLMFEKFRGLLSYWGRKRGAEGTTLVNAAVVKGRKGEIRQPAIVVSI